MADESYEIYHKLKVVVSLSSSVPDHCIQKTAASKGWLAQTNHLLHHGVSTSQFQEFKNSIRTVEQQHGGATLTKAHGNLNIAHTSQRKTRNTCLSDVVDLVGGSGDTQRIPCPENWPFACPSSPQGEIESMVTQTRARATKRMTNKSLNESARKKILIAPDLQIRTRSMSVSSKTFCLKWGLRESHGYMICLVSC